MPFWPLLLLRPLGYLWGHPWIDRNDGGCTNGAFTFFLDPIPALALMIAVGASSIYAGDIPGALLRIPGTPASAAYVADSNELVKQGKVNRVLGLGLVSSVIGGVIGSLILMLAAPVLAKFALNFSSYEYTWLSLLGLTCATLVVGNQPLKGMVTLCLGLLLACIGYDQISGVPRFTFGQISLLQGVNFIPAMIGLFAISGAIEYYRDKISQVSGVVPQTQTGINLFKGMGQVIWSRKLNLGRSSIIGTLIGALPGAGADIAAWISYAISKNSLASRSYMGMDLRRQLLIPRAVTTPVWRGVGSFISFRYSGRFCRCNYHRRALYEGYESRADIISVPGR